MRLAGCAGGSLGYIDERGSGYSQVSGFRGGTGTNNWKTFPLFPRRIRVGTRNWGLEEEATGNEDDDAWQGVARQGLGTPRVQR